MTEQEAIKSALQKVEAQQENLGGFMDRFDIPEHWAVRKALEKQIAKKVIGIEAKLLNRYCPSCDAWAGVDLKKNMKYCPNCGQKLDWSEV